MWFFWKQQWRWCKHNNNWWDALFCFSLPLTREAATGDVHCFNKNCKGEKCVFLYAHITNPRSIYGGGKCGLLSLVLNELCTLQEHVKTTKTDKTRFFWPTQKKLLPGKQIFIIASVQSTKYSEKKVQFLSGQQSTSNKCRGESSNM